MSERTTFGGARDEPDPSAFDEGRYLYCVVDTEGRPDASVFSAGVDGEGPYLIERSGVGLVVHACESPYESGDAGTVKRWLLQHQGIIDEAGETFGTPLPFRFDTILKGDDERVREWVGEESDVLDDALSELSGKWEYRIEVIWDRTGLEDQLATEDERLAELEEERQDASGGTEFLLDKQYEQRLREVRESRLHGETSALADRLRGIASEVREVDQTASLLGDERARERNDHRSALAVLAPEVREEPIGDLLDELAVRPGVEVRFTGPWPPYSFAPALGGDP